MGNRLFQDARRFVEMAELAAPDEKRRAVDIAQNALSSAYANSTFAEMEQLRGFQEQLDKLK